MKKEKKLFDLATEQELSIAVMNLISIEEHLAFTAGKTRAEKYVDVYNAVRKLRSKYLKRLVKNKQGEAWCVSKHLLAATMRLMETAVKYGAEGNKKEALEIFSDAIDTYQLFWLLQEFGKEGARK